MSNLFIIGLGNSLLHWTNYVCDVHRSQILNEGSIKYAISEYVEVEKNSNIACVKSGRESIVDRDPVKEYKFEYNHEALVKRRVDLFVKCSKSCMFFEFKFAHSHSLTLDEIRRYYADIFRLSLMHKINSSNLCYFVLLGSSTDSFLSSININESARPDIVGNNKTYFEKQLRTVLPFKIGEGLPVDINSLKVGNDNFLQWFNNNYTYTDSFNDKLNIGTINIKLIYPCDDYSASGMTAMSVYIWEIKNR